MEEEIRNNEIYTLYMAGHRKRGLLTRLAVQYGLTRERIRAIIVAGDKKRNVAKKEVEDTIVRNGLLPNVKITTAQRAALDTIAAMRQATLTDVIRDMVAWIRCLRSCSS